MKPDRAAIFAEINEILVNYDLGTLDSFEKNERGYVNTSYGITTRKMGKINKYFLRRYKSGIQEVEIKFEHEVINHCLQNNFELVPRVFSTRSGSTYFKKKRPDQEGPPIFYSIFEFLAGEDKYTCVDPRCSKAEIKNSAAVLAQFHLAVFNLVPTGKRFEPRILDLLPRIKTIVGNSSQFSKDTGFDAYLIENSSQIIEDCTLAEEYFAGLPTSTWAECVIHCDYHPGNLKFDGEKVVGLFDFDWSKIEWRSFDVALAIWYFFVSWRGKENGILRLEESRIFLDKYQSTIQNLKSSASLTSDELHHLPMMINLGNLYVINWAITDYYAKDFYPEENLEWLQHCLNFSRWFRETGFRELQNLFS